MGGKGRSAQSEIRASFPKQFKIHKIIIDSENALKHYLNGKMVRCDYP